MDEYIELSDMLAARERRAFLQNEILGKYPMTLISFTMNIAGPVKHTRLIERGFHQGMTLLRRALAEEDVRIEYEYILEEKTGCEAFLSVDGDPSRIKKVTSEIEDDTPLGRLFDMDVLNERGAKLERTDLGLPVRKCLICGKPARECARSRTHSVPELQAKTREFLEMTFRDLEAKKVAELAVRSLLYEVGTTPKPGLVDRMNSGSHRDMDMFTFMNSASALWPYFYRCAGIGRDTVTEGAAETFRRIRLEGKKAEQTMRVATKGVNTHKGAIFTMGVAAAALGRLPVEKWTDADSVLDEVSALTGDVILRDFDGVTEDNARTFGQKYYVQYGITGVRGQAAEGYPAVRYTGLPVLQKGIRNGMSVNDAGCAALLHILASMDDTNMIHRAGREMQLTVREKLREFLRETPYPSMEQIEDMDQEFIRMNLSPGGSADLLAVCYLLYFLQDEDELEGLI